MDGLPANVTMCNLLGCSLKLPDVKPWFEFRGSRIYVIFDACHMIKLARNVLENCEEIKSQEQLSIRWNDITNLHNLQKEAGLRLANKLTNRHINFHKLKMKVSD